MRSTCCVNGLHIGGGFSGRQHHHPPNTYRDFTVSIPGTEIRRLESMAGPKKKNDGPRINRPTAVVVKRKHTLHPLRPLTLRTLRQVSSLAPVSTVDIKVRVPRVVPTRITISAILTVIITPEQAKEPSNRTALFPFIGFTALRRRRQGSRCARCRSHQGGPPAGPRCHAVPLGCGPSSGAVRRDRKVCPLRRPPGRRRRRWSWRGPDLGYLRHCRSVGWLGSPQPSGK